MYRVRDFYRGSDDITRIVALVALIILLIVTLPTFARRAPLFANGVSCDALSTVPGNGTNQSILKPEPGALRLELTSKPTYIVGEPLQLTVRFQNAGPAPIVFPFVASEAVLRYSGREEGLSFWIQFAGNGQVLGEPVTSKPPPPIRQQFSSDTLRWLGPYQSCTQAFAFDANRIRAAGIGTGDYRIAAVYRNTQRGALSAVGQLTPTPVFRDQGVWTTIGDVRSNQVVVTVGGIQ